MSSFQPKPSGNIVWEMVSDVPKAAKSFTLFGDAVEVAPGWYYSVYDNSHGYAVDLDKYKWYIAASDGTSTLYWGGKPIESGADPHELTFVTVEMPGEGCASQRACEKIINGQKVCVSWDKKNWLAYFLKAGAIVGAGSAAGAVTRKKNRKQGAALGALGGAAAVVVLYAMNALRPKNICEE